MSVIIVGDPATARALAEGPEAPENARVWDAPAPAQASEATAVAALATALAALEADLQGQECEAMVLADDSEQALAGALVATKLLIPVFATARAADRGSANGRLIAELAATYTGAP